jgi:hypothetical protein
MTRKMFPRIIAILKFLNIKACGTFRYNYLDLKIQIYASQRPFGSLRQGRAASLVLGG